MDPNPWQKAIDPAMVRSIQTEHHEVLDLLHRINEALDATQRILVRRLLLSLREVLTEHRGKEETSLYPALDRALGPDLTPSGDLLADHRSEEAIMARALASLEAGRFDAAREDLKHLIGSVRDHIWKEENLVLPFVERALELAARGRGANPS